MQKLTINFFTGIKAKKDRKIVSLTMLTNTQILAEKIKMTNLRNGKVRP